ncbi:hypothetical protein LOK49_LG07G00453 [Camellia lanceoleosa]|uniref:Uncharacterized protein n=1 Tax=Camellia lanceoleosa TaxID=1840588 RepID=A0ACC0H017_9ERIC|nr:hypothetical protein LOK49_LG07G00453 [Camellia lanceoleosa]
MLSIRDSEYIFPILSTKNGASQTLSIKARNTQYTLIYKSNIKIPFHSTQLTTRRFSGDLNLRRLIQSSKMSDHHRTEYSWTNERHMHYLNSMEASFVRTMLQNNNNNNAHLLPRLDRYLPDTSESTLDLKSDRRRRHSTSGMRNLAHVSLCRNIPDARTRTHKKSGKLSSQPHTSSQDQVVPQLENGTADNFARGLPDVPAVTSAAPLK